MTTTQKIVSRWDSSKTLFECELPEERVADVQFLADACEMRGGCLCWTLSLTSGAGRVKLGGKKVYAHRAMYELIHGQIPASLLVRHACDNRACILPAHLELGTHADNMRDMVQRGRSTKGRTLSAEHRRKVSEAQRGRQHPAHVKREIADSVRAYRAGSTR
jgi:HNH endonuclease